jgi:hypothetical protein
LALCCLTLLFFYRTHLFGDQLRFTLDRNDPLIELSRLEHWFGVFRGWYNWRDPIYFYPEKGVLGYGDGYFLYGIFYSALRVFGIDPLVSMELTTATVRGVGFLAAWALLRRYFGSSVWTAAFGAVLMTVSNGVYLGTMHTQLATVAFVPLAFFLAARTRELLIKERLCAATGTAAGLGILLAGWLMTAFYTFWFAGLFLLITIGVFAVIGRAQLVAVVREMLGERRWRILVPGVAIFALGLIPFAMTYYPTARATGMHSIGVIYFYSPQILDLVNVGPGNLLWSRFSTWLHDIVLSPTKNEELWQGFTPLELAFLCTVAVTSFARSARTSRSSLIYQSLLIAIFLGIALEVQIGGFTLWAWIYKLVPGARAVRVVVRFQLVLLTIGALVVAMALEKLSRNHQIWHRYLLSILIGMAILIEQVNVYPIARLTRSDVPVLGALPAHPEECRVFYTVNPVVPPRASEGERKYYIHSVEAMLLATMTRMPTVLGMDAFLPPRWNLHSPLTADYDLRVYMYAQRRGLLQGLCALDLTAMTWRLIDRPPNVPHTHPLGSGLVDRDQLSFADGQPGVSMLADGWSEPEAWGVWATGTQSTLSLRLSSDLQSSGVSLGMTIGAFLPPGIDNKRIDVFLGEPTEASLIAQWKLTRAPEEKEFCIPANAIPRDRLIKLTFKADRSYSPGEDSRVLNVALQSLSVHAEPCSANSH